jgi:hypothetical protein
MSTVITDRLAWYAARARAMSPREIVWRAGSRAVPLLRRARPTPVLAAGLHWNIAYQRFRAATDRPVLLDAARAAELAAALPDEVAAVVAAADLVRERRFGYFGQEPVAFPGGDVDWNLDPRTGHHWPLVPATALDHRTCPGDPKWIWELNRLQHLPWLAQAWLFTGDRGYADAALDQLDSFLAQNPVGRGIAWRGAFEAGIRAISVAVALQGLRTAPAMTPDRYRGAVEMLAASAELAWRDRSRFSSANNHLLGEMVGVAVVALLHPELASAAALERRALGVLAAEAGRQILPDGAGAEQSAAYQVFASELLLVPAVLLRLRGAEPPVEILSALRRGSAYLSALVADGDPCPRYGDDDGGFALRLHPDAVPTLRRHLAAVATLIGPTGTTPDLGSDRAPDLAASWLGGGHPAPAPLRPAPLRRDFYAEAAGLVVLRRGGRRITMDVGPLGYLSIAAHGHADALAVTITDGGGDLVGDPGTGSYYAEPAWRAAFRGTRMHPTASVDDLDQSVQGGPFLWIRHAVTSVRGVDLVRGVVDAEHDGYARLHEPVHHRRWLVAPPDWSATVVVDLFTGVGVHRLRTAWPLHPDLAARTVGSVHHVDRAGVPVLAIATAATAPTVGYAVHGDEEERLGWWSDRFESRRPAWLVGAVAEEVAMPVAVASVLTPGEPPADLAVHLRDDVIDVSWADRWSVRIDTRAAGAVSCSSGGV